MSTIAVAKSAMGYQTAGQRDSCRNCRHSEAQNAERMPPFDRASLRCTKGGFITSNMALCIQYVQKSRANSGDRA